MNFSIPKSLSVQTIIALASKLYGNPLTSFLESPLDDGLLAFLDSNDIKISVVHAAHTGYVVYIFDDYRGGRWLRYTMPTTRRELHPRMLHTCIRVAIEQLTAPK